MKRYGTPPSDAYGRKFKSGVGWGGGGRHKALVVSSGSLWRRLLASRL